MAVEAGLRPRPLILRLPLGDDGHEGHVATGQPRDGPVRAHLVPAFATFHFLSNLRIRPKSYSVTLH